ncbi:helix-turn-helix transcriptional regulator [Chloroflexota bacterium]
MEEWSLITSHGLVLAAISRNSQKTTREIGDDVGITERRAHGIIVDLEQAGYIQRTKVGNHNVYTLNPDVPLRSRLSDASVGDLLKLFGWRRQKRTKKAAQDNV